MSGVSNMLSLAVLRFDPDRMFLMSGGSLLGKVGLGLIFGPVGAVMGAIAELMADDEDHPAERYLASIGGALVGTDLADGVLNGSGSCYDDALAAMPGALVYKEFATGVLQEGVSDFLTYSAFASGHRSPTASSSFSYSISFYDCGAAGCPGAHSSRYDKCFQFPLPESKPLGFYDCGATGCPGMHSSRYDKCFRFPLLEPKPLSFYDCGATGCPGVHSSRYDKCFQFPLLEPKPLSFYDCGAAGCPGVHSSRYDKCFRFPLFEPKPASW
jgi:hypothetical protein